MKGEVKILSRYADGTPFRLLWRGRKEYSHLSCLECYEFFGEEKIGTKYNIFFEKYPNKKAYKKKEVEFVLKVEKKC